MRARAITIKIPRRNPGDFCCTGQQNQAEWAYPVSQSPLHSCAMLSPLCTRGAAASRRCRSSLCLGAYNRAFLMHSARIALWPLPGDGLSHPGSVTLHPYCAPTLGNRARWNHSLSFTIPPAWLRHAVPPLHKGGFSLPHCIQPAFVLLLSAAAQYGCPDTGLLPGDGLSHPEHRAWQRIKPSASFGRPDTGP